MSRLASAADFENGVIYTNYHRYPYFAERADLIVSRFPTATKILIAGCGYGYLVDELLQRGKDGWGIDAAAYAQGKASERLPFASSSRIILASTTNRTELAAARTAAGLTGNNRFSLIVTEDLLPCCTSEAEAQTMLTELRRIGTTLFHICTCTSPADPNDLDARYPGLLWRSHAQWKAIVGTESVMNAEGGAIL